MQKTITDSDAGKRLDVYLQEVLTQTRSHIQHMIEKKQVFVNGKVVKCGFKLKTGDFVDYEILPAKQIDTEADQSVEFDIVFEDDDLVVVNKPQGLVVHPCQSTTSKTLVNGLLAKITNLSGINGEIRPGIVHRLDKNTSGVMLVAKNDRAHVDLANQIQNKTCKRKYYALLEGVISKDEFEIDTYLSRDKKDRKKISVCPAGEGRRAISVCRVVQRYSKHTLCEFELKTGRTHQIRVHAKHISHPVVGDDVYNAKSYPKLKGQLLHSYFISFCHPTTKSQMQFSVPLPQHFQNFISLLK